MSDEHPTPETPGSEGASGADSGNQPPGDRGWGEPRTRTVTWYAQQSFRPLVETLSGLEYLECVVSGELPPPPVVGVGLMTLEAVEHGSVLLNCTPDESWLNPNGMVHGGLLCTMMDLAVGLAVTSTVDSMRRLYGTIELKVSFLKPLPFDGSAIAVRGRTLRVGRKVAFGEAHAHGPNGTLVGHATSSLAIVDPV